MNTFSFTRGRDPLKKMVLGKPALREKWLEKMGIERYKINKDETIYVYGSVKLTGEKIHPCNLHDKNEEAGKKSCLAKHLFLKIPLKGKLCCSHLNYFRIFNH